MRARGRACDSAKLAVVGMGTASRDTIAARALIATLTCPEGAGKRLAAPAAALAATAARA